MNSRSNTIFWAIIACLLWSTAAPGIKIGLEFSTPLHFAGVRFIISGLLVLPFTVKPGMYLKIIRENISIVLLVTLFQSILNYILFYKGLNLVPGALGAIIIGSQPLIIALVAAYMIKEDKLTARKIVIITIGIAGVVLVSIGRQSLKLGTLSELLGVIMILGANVASAISNVLVSKNGKNINPFVLSSFSLFAGGVVIFAISLITEKHTAFPTGAGSEKYYISLLWLSFMSSFAFSIWYLLLQRPGVKVADLNLWKFIIPVFGAILSWILVEGENPQWLTITGMIIITLSLVLFYRCNQHTKTC